MAALISWYECDGRGHYDPQPYDPGEAVLLTLEELRDSQYVGPERREIASEDKHPTWDWLKGYKGYVCRRCKAENTDDSCVVCGAPCEKRLA